MTVIGFTLLSGGFVLGKKFADPLAHLDDAFIFIRFAVDNILGKRMAGRRPAGTAVKVRQPFVDLLDGLHLAHCGIHIVVQQRNRLVFQPIAAEIFLRHKGVGVFSLYDQFCVTGR